MEPVRKFKIIVNSKECGTCSGPTPSAVAKKVVKKLCGTSSKVVKFSLKECKRGCERVCGPYQGQMEKLDKPCKRDGKTITHRVVCGKVKKMRGGDLELNEYLHPIYVKKKDDSPNFNARVIRLGQSSFTDVFFFLGEIIIDDTKYYKYILTTDSDSFIISTTNGIVKDGNKDLIDYTTIVIHREKLNNQTSNLPDGLISEIKGLTDEEIFKFEIYFGKNYHDNSRMGAKFNNLVNLLKKYRKNNQ